jgi:signal transduction histidine kinase
LSLVDARIRARCKRKIRTMARASAKLRRGPESLASESVELWIAALPALDFNTRASTMGEHDLLQSVEQARHAPADPVDDSAERGAEFQLDRLRSLASEIVIAEERLRQSLAADLHNGLGQDIALAKLRLSALRTSSGAELRDSLIGIERLVEHADHSLRSITYQLSPPSLRDLGLVPALQWLAEDIGVRYRVDVRIDDEGIAAVADERMRVILYRAVRELLMNIATHANAREAHVRLRSDTLGLRITVEDDGTGFDTRDVAFKGYGLFGIREQLRYIGGNMRIESGPGRGTTVLMTTPLAAAT